MDVQHTAQRLNVDGPRVGAFTRVPRVRAAAIAGLVAVLCGGCAFDSAGLRGNHASPRVNLGELIAVQAVVANPDTGLHDRRVTLFYSRETGQPVRVPGIALESDFAEGVAVARREDAETLGYIDVARNVAIPFQYYTAEPFSEGRAVVSVAAADQKARFGLIDRNGKWIVPPGRYAELGPFREGRCAFRIGERWGLLDALGNEVVLPRFSEPPCFYEGLAAAQDEQGRPAFVDRFGQVRVRTPEDTEAVHDYHNGLARFVLLIPEIDDDPFGPPPQFRSGFLSVAGTVVVPPEYAQAGDFSEGLAAVSVNAAMPFRDDRDPMEFGFDTGEQDSWGYIDTTGKVAIPFQFNRVGRFSGGLARVKQNGKWGYIDQTGRFVIPPRYQWARDFRHGIAEVWEDGRIYFIDRTGKVVVETNLPAVTF